MKNLKVHLLLATFLVAGCAQEINELTPPDVGVVVTPTGTPGSLTLTKFSTLGNSLVAGFRSNALYTNGQNESLGKIMAKQLSYAGGSQTFNQPDINSANGFSGSPGGGILLGRLVLFDPDGAGPRSPSPTPSGSPERSVSCPSVLTTPAMPAPFNSADLPSAYTGNKAALNNFAVPGIQVGQVLTNLTGGPSTGNPAYNALYARFASNPGTSTILGDFIASQPTFFLIEVGNNDILGYATSGGANPAIFTSEADFSARFNGMINTILASLPTAKGVVANIPDVTTIPFFFTVPYNAVSLTADQATALNSAFAGYNAVMDAIAGNPNLLAFSGSTAANLQARKVTYTTGAGNKILIAEKTSDFPDLGPTFDQLVAASQMTPAQRAALEPYRRVRQTTATDLITLPAGSVLGTCLNPPGNNPSLIIGTSMPLADQFVLLPSEILDIRTRTAAFNQIIATSVANSNNRLALANVNAAFTDFVVNKGKVVNGLLLTPSITPPYGAFSEDAVHPNGRGYAFLANIFIEAINAKFGSTIPLANVTEYTGNRTPVTLTSSY